MLGERLADRYELLSELGRGGMGIVYRAHDPRLSREVAVKVVAPAMLTPETERRFQTEAQLVAQMDHPSIVPIHDFGNHEGSLFFVMPIIEGDSLRDLMRRGSLTLGTVVDLGVKVAEALDYSHGRGVVHRDIKPENLMVSILPGGEVRVRIMDFGLARGTNVASMTKTGMLVGTLSYISPEQVSGGQIDGRTDIYSLGCVLYECMTQEVPFAGEMQAVLYRVVHEAAQSPRSMGADVDPELERIVLSCLEKSPGARPQSGADLASLLRRYRASVTDSKQMESVLMTATMVAPRPALAPFVGRTAEFRRLQARLNTATRGECQLVVVSGEAGVGKTRLLDELEQLATVRSIPVLHGRFVDEENAFPFHGFCEAIQEHFRRAEAAGSGEPLDLSDLAGDLLALFPMLSEVEAIRTAAGGSGATASRETHLPDNKTQIYEILARTLTQLAGRETLLLLLEDLHGAEASIEALRYVVRRLGPTPTLIVGTYRSEEVDADHPLPSMLESFAGDRRFEAIRLDPFSPEEHRAFLETLTGGSLIADGLAIRLWETTGGNPFFTKEMLRSLMDSGSVEQDATGVWSLSGGIEISSEDLPATIQQAVQRRVSGLPDDLRRLLATASVMGTAFDFDDLEALADDAADPDEAVDRFIQEGLLEEDRQSHGDRLVFSSAVVREVLYGELSRRKRRTLHRRFAEQLEKRNAGRLDRVYPQLVHHFYEGDVPEKTVEYGLLHARNSLATFNPEDALRSSRLALEYLDEDWEGERSDEADARMLLSEAYLMTGSVTEGLAEAERAIGILEAEGETARAAQALLTAAEAGWQSRRTEETREWVERGIVAARAANDSDTLGRLLSLAATLASLRGEYDRSAAFLEESSALLVGKEDAEIREEVPRGGELVVGLLNPVTGLRPAELRIVEEREVFSNVVETLLTSDEEGRLLPLLAESWEVLDGGRSVRLVLQPDARFSDGSALTADHVKRAFEATIREFSAGALPPVFAAIRGATALAEGNAEALEGISLKSDRELQIDLGEALPIYPALLTDARGAIGRDPGDESGFLLGTGPFRFASREANRVVLEQNPEYWRGGPPPLDRIEFRTLPGSAAIASGFRAGEIDLARDLVPGDLESLLQDPRFRRSLVEAPQKITYFVLCNVLSGPVVRDATIRRALTGAVQVSDLVWQAGGRFTQPATGLVPPGVLGHDPGRRPRSLGLDEAREILKSAGAGDGLELTAVVHPLIRDRYGSLLEALFGVWKELGVTVRTRDADMATFLRLFHDNEGIDLLISRWMIDYEDPDGITHALFHSGAGAHRAYCSSPEIDEILEAARAESRPDARQGWYRKLERRLIDESDAFLPLFHDVGYRLASPRVKGVRLGNVAPFVNYGEVGKLAQAAPIVGTVGGGIIRFPMAGHITTLDPSELPTREDMQVRASAFESLLRDRGVGRIEPWLAEEYRIDEGGRRFHFRLRSPVHFHDGRRLTSRDVRYSFERLLRTIGPGSSWFYLPIVGARDVMEGRKEELPGFRIHSLRDFSIELDEPMAYFPALIAMDATVVIPEGLEETGTTWREGLVGTGPYRIAQYEPGRRLELEPNPLYWRRDRPRNEGVEITFGVPPEEILAGFRSGQYAVVGDLFPAEVEALRRDAELGSGYRETPGLVTYFAAWNRHRGPGADRGLRKRLFDSLDVGSLVKQTLGNLAQPASGLIPPGLLGHDPRKLIPAAVPAVPRGGPGPLVEVRAAMHPVLASELRRFGDSLIHACRRAGVDLQPVTPTMDEFLKTVRECGADLFIGRWNADYADPDSFAYLVESKAGFVGSFCGSPELDQLIESGRVVTDPQARHAIYRRIEEILAREALLLPLFHEQIYRFGRPEVEGLEISYTSEVDFSRLRIRPR